MPLRSTRGEQCDLDSLSLRYLRRERPLTSGEIQKPSRTSHANGQTPIRRDCGLRIANADAADIAGGAFAEDNGAHSRRVVPPNHGDAAGAVLPKAHTERGFLDLG